MSSKYIKKYPIPKEFPEILGQFIKEILRNQPLDIVDFGIEFFRCVEEQKILDYAHKGQNIPCDFKPKIPTITKNEKRKILTHEEYQKYQESITQSQIEKEKEKENENEINKPIIKEDKKVVERQESEKSDKLMRGGGVMIDNEEENEEENMDINEKENNKKFLSTGSNIGEIRDSSPPHTLTDFNLDNYEDCIDFNEKEEQLNKLKEENKGNVNQYIENVFNPNKNLNDILINMQETLMSYYKNKGTENENEYEKLNEDLKNKLSEAKLQILENDPKTQSLNDAISDFKSYDYYPRTIRCYSIKLNEPSEENNPYLDEFCFFLFNHRLQKVIEDDDPKILEKYPYVKQYFVHNIELLQPEIYSFVLNSKYYPNDEFCNNFSSFSVRKRELCQNFYKLMNLGDNSKEVNQCLNNMENCHYISSPKQIYAKLSTVNDNNKEEIESTVTEKLQSNYKKIWNFISRVINTPIELVEQSYYDFMSYKPIERSIIIDYLTLNPDYHEIHDKFNSLEVDPDESNFYHRMKELYMELTHSPELDYRNMCIYRNKLFDIPEQAKKYIEKFDDINSTLNDEELFNEYKTLNPLSQDGVYYYLIIKQKNDDRLTNLNLKIGIEKQKREANSFKNRGKSLSENFTLDSDEFEAFKNEYFIWKDNCNSNLKEYFNIDDSEKDNYFKDKLNNEEKKIVFDMLEIENILNEEYPLKDKIEAYSNLITE